MTKSKNAPPPICQPRSSRGSRRLLRGGAAISSGEDTVTIERSLSLGHVAAVLGGGARLRATAWLAAASAPIRPTLMALPVAYVLNSVSMLATRRMLRANTAANSLGARVGRQESGAQ